MREALVSFGLPPWQADGVIEDCDHYRPRRSGDRDFNRARRHENRADTILFSSPKIMRGNLSEKPRAFPDLRC